MDNLVWIIPLIVVVVIVVGVLYLTRGRSDQKKIGYVKKQFLTPAEASFLKTIKSLEKEGYLVIPQVNLATVIAKTGEYRWQPELYRNIDFGVFDQEYNLLLLIELNDYSHNWTSRQERDLKVRNICSQAEIALMTFYTNKPNKPDYVLNRIKNEIVKS